MMLIYVLKQLWQRYRIGIRYFKTILWAEQLIKSSGNHLKNKPKGGEIGALQPYLEVIFGNDDRHGDLVVVVESELFFVSTEGPPRIETLNDVLEERGDRGTVAV